MFSSNTWNRYSHRTVIRDGKTFDKSKSYFCYNVIEWDRHGWLQIRCSGCVYQNCNHLILTFNNVVCLRRFLLGKYCWGQRTTPMEDTWCFRAYESKKGSLWCMIYFRQPCAVVLYCAVLCCVVSWCGVAWCGVGAVRYNTCNVSPVNAITYYKCINGKKLIHSWLVTTFTGATHVHLWMCCFLWYNTLVGIAIINKWPDSLFSPAVNWNYDTLSYEKYSSNQSTNQ